MAIGADKTRTQLTIEKELKTKLEQIAKEEDRSFNNMVIKIIKDFVDERESKNDV